MFAIHPSTIDVLSNSVRADIDRQARMRQVTGKGRTFSDRPAVRAEFAFATITATMVALLGMLLIG
jgi:hypothetical protein